MSLDATRWAWKQKLSATEKIVLLSMADRAGRQHTCWPSTLRLSKDTSLTERTIFNTLNRLESLGIIRREVRPGRTTIYHLIGVPGRGMERDLEHGMERDVEHGMDRVGDRAGAQAPLGQCPHHDAAAPCTAVTPELNAGHPCTTCIPPLNDVHLESIRESTKESQEREARLPALAHACSVACATGKDSGEKSAEELAEKSGKDSAEAWESPSAGESVRHLARQSARSAGSSSASRPAPKDATPKIAHGEHAHVLLTEAEHARLMTGYGQEWTHEAITLLDLHISAGGKDRYASHCAALQKWVFDAINERRLKLRMTPFTRPAPATPASPAVSAVSSSLPRSPAPSSSLFSPSSPGSPSSPSSLSSSSPSCSPNGHGQRQASIKQPYDYEPTPEELARNRQASRDIRQKYFQHREEGQR